MKFNLSATCRYEIIWRNHCRIHNLRIIQHIHAQRRINNFGTIKYLFQINTNDFTHINIKKNSCRLMIKMFTLSTTHIKTKYLKKYIINRLITFNQTSIHNHRNRFTKQWGNQQYQITNLLKIKL